MRVRQKRARVQHLELCVRGPAGEGNDVTDVVQPGGEEDETLQTQAEPAVYRGAEPPEVQVPAAQKENKGACVRVCVCA